MRVSRFRRFFSIALSAWFVASAGGPVGELSCPEHGAHSAADVAASVELDHAAVDHSDHATAADDAAAHHGGGHHGDCCTCPGKCSASHVATQSASIDATAGFDISLVAFAIDAAEIVVPAPDAWILPPSNGPPAQSPA